MKNFFLKLGVCALALTGAAEVLAQEQVIQLFAHRGSRFEYDENTLPAFKASYDAGLRGFETDIRMTRDGALVMRLDSTMVGLVKLRVAALPDSLRRSAALLDKVSGMTNIMLMTGLARTLDPAADTTAFVRLESDFRADVAALTAEPVRRRLFREREAGVEVAGYYSAAPSGEAELVLVVSGGGNEALCVLGGRFGEEEALRLATMQREQLLGRGGTR